jgi:hypothetical protein
MTEGGLLDRVSCTTSHKYANIFPKYLTKNLNRPYFSVRVTVSCSRKKHQTRVKKEPLVVMLCIAAQMLVIPLVYKGKELPRYKKQISLLSFQAERTFLIIISMVVLSLQTAICVVLYIKCSV